jgi:peptidoglycan/LPS O-acetylase OafA/YrhL
MPSVEGMTLRTPQPMIRRGHVPALDGLRGVAVLAVMLFHLITACGYGSDAWVTRKIIGLAVPLWSGVDLFFVLSGFLITGILLRVRDQPSYFKNFYVRRSLRIFPLYYAALVVIFLVLPRFVVFDTPGVQRVFHAQGWLWAYSEDIAIFVHNEDFFDPDPLWVGHFWSLAVEEHFYLVWPLVVYFCRRRTLIVASLFLIVATPLIRGLMLARHLDMAMIYTQTFSRTDELALGGLLAIAAEALPYAQLARYARWAVGVSIAAVVLAMFIQGGPLWWGHWTSLGPGFSALALGATGLMVFAVSPEGNVFSRLLEGRVLRAFGKYSYGLYVLHVPLQPLYLHLFPPMAIGALARGLGHTGSRVVGLLGFAALGLALTMMLAALSFHFFEQPFLRLKRFFEYSERPESSSGQTSAAVALDAATTASIREPPTSQR